VGHCGVTRRRGWGRGQHLRVAWARTGRFKAIQAQDGCERHPGETFDKEEWEKFEFSPVRRIRPGGGWGEEDRRQRVQRTGLAS
jgi:hypothetical protein